jgi:hypothetical protein
VSEREPRLFFSVAERSALPNVASLAAGFMLEAAGTTPAAVRYGTHPPTLPDALRAGSRCADSRDRGDSRVSLQARIERSETMSESVYRVTEVIGASADSWEAAARNAVETAARTVRDLRIAEATRFDVTIRDGKVAEYRVRLDVSFKYDTGD